MSNDHELLPLGYRFFPTEEELLSFYLHNKLAKVREADIERVIPVADIYRLDPWQLPEISGEPCIRDSEQWFFFCPRQPREAHGGRPTRTTPSGYWKATGSPGPVYSSTNRARVLGVKKMMVFYMGRARAGTKTKWKMNEYRALEGDEALVPGSTPKVLDEFSLCRVYKNSGCVRAFDRRPSMVAIAGDNPDRADDALHNNTARHSAGAKRARSEDSSSSGSSPPALQGGTNLKALEDIDWDQLDWV